MLEVEECSGFDRGQEDDGLFIGEKKKSDYNASRAKYSRLF